MADRLGSMMAPLLVSLRSQLEDNWAVDGVHSPKACPITSKTAHRIDTRPDRDKPVLLNATFSQEVGLQRAIADYHIREAEQACNSTSQEFLPILDPSGFSRMNETEYHKGATPLSCNRKPGDNERRMGKHARYHKIEACGLCETVA
jgi:hypothetical protein